MHALMKKGFLTGLVSFSKYGSDQKFEGLQSRDNGLTKKGNWNSRAFRTCCINSVRNTYFVKEIFFQLFCFMDIILTLHMYPENI